MTVAISLVMTTHNRERYLAAAIESILKQTRSDFELLIWDDGSTDASLEIARSYAQQDTRIQVIEAVHQGRVLALQWAIEQTTGTYLGFIDSDDLLAPTALQKTAAILDAQPAIGWVYTDYLDIDQQGKVLGYGHRCRIPYSSDRLLVDFMTHHFRLLRRSVYEQAGGLDSSMQCAEDYDLCLRLSEISKVQRIRKPLYLYRNHPENIGMLEKIVWSREAIQRALKRRGLDQHFQIDVIRNHFILHQKRQSKRSMLQRLGAPLAALSLAGAMIQSQPAQAQRIDPARDGTGTEVRTRGNRHDITGGRRSADGENLFHSFERFGLSEGEIANFLSRPEIVNILGRITGGEISFINGMLRITGGNSNLYLMNPAGIVFGPHATLDLAGSFTATTATGIGFDNRWFNAVGENNYALLNGNPNAFAFTVNQPGVIINAGDLSVASGQSLGLVSGVVVNTGELSAPNGQLTAIAVPGQSVVRLSQPGNVLSLEVPIAPGSNQPNQWTLPINALPQLLTSGSAGQDLGLQVNQNGQVALVDSGTEIPPTPGTTVISGRLDASTTQADERGGTVQVLGDRVGLVGAQVESTGTNGGGTVLIGGDYQGQGTVPNATRTHVSRDSSINVSATQAGDGGRAIVWSDGTTTFQGEAIARGGRAAGNGGLIETSGRESLAITSTPDASAPNGRSGTWLIDPTDIEIVAAGTGYEIGSSQVDVGIINDALSNGTSVTITTDIGGEEAGDITQNEGATISKAGGPETTLTLDADNDIDLNDDILASDGSLNVTLNAGRNIDFDTINSGGGEINIDAITAVGSGYGDVSGTTIESAGGNINVSATDEIDITEITNGGDITLDGGTIDLGGEGGSPDAITGTGDVLLQAPIGSIGIDGNILIAEDGSVTMSSGDIDAGDITTNGGSVNLSAEGNEEFGGDIDFGTINSGGGSVDIDAIAAVGSGYGDVFGTSIQSQGGNISVSAADNLGIFEIDSGAGDITLTGNEIDLGDGEDGTVSGGGNLIFQSATSDQSIVIGGDEEVEFDTALNLSDLDLESLQDGFFSITIGNTNGSGTVTVLGSTAPLFSDPVTIQSPLGSVTVSGTLITNGNASVTLNGSTTFNQRIIENPEAPSTVINPGITTEGQNITINGNTTLNNDTTLDTGATGGGNILLNGIVNGASDLTIATGTGRTTFTGAVGNTTPLTSLNLDSAANLNGGSVTTTGDQLYNRPITLGADTTLTGNDITFNATIDSDTVAPRSLAVNTTDLPADTITGGGVDIGVTTFNDIVGGSNPLSGLTTNAAGQTIVGANITTTGDGIQLNDPVTLNNDVTLSESGNGNIGFGSTVNSDSAATPRSLTVSPENGRTTFNGTVGNVAALQFLAVNSAATLAGGTTTSVTTVGEQQYGGPLTLDASSIVLSAGSGITFNETVDGNAALTVNGGTGQVVFGASVGSTTGLQSLTVNSAAILNGNSITTTGSQFYQRALTLGTEATTLTGSDIRFATIASGGGSIDIDAIALVGSGYGIVSGSIIESAGGNVDVSATNGIGIGAITNGGNINLSGGNINLGGAVDNPNAITGTGDLTLQAATGAITLNGDIRISGNNAITITGERFAIGLDAEDNANLAAIGQDGNVTVSELETFVSGLDTLIQTQGGEVRITATNGGILAGRINTNGGDTRLTARGTNVPDNSLASPEERLTQNGGIVFNTIDSEGGNVRTDATGNADANGLLVGATGFNAIDSGGGNVTLNAQGTGPQAGSIGFGTIDSGSGDVEITAVDNTPANTPTSSTIAGRTIRSEGGDVTVFGTGQTFNIDIGEINSANGDVFVRGGGNTDVRTPVINAGSGNITIAADEINFLGRDSSAGSITGTGNLTLQPFTSSLNILVGSAPGTGASALDLSTTDLDAIQDGFNLIRIGRENGGGTVTVSGRNTALFSDPVLIRSPDQGAINIQGTLIGTDNASITLEGATTFDLGRSRTSGIRTAGQDITINGDTDLNVNTALNTGPNDGDITLNGTVNGGSALTLDAGGQAAINEEVGNIEPLAALSIDASDEVILGAPITTTGDIDVIGASIQPGTENGARLNTTEGNVDLASRDGDIEVETIATQGGDITVNSDRFFRATGTLGQGSSRNTSIDSSGGSISITHAGGERSDPVESFVVGDASENGTAGNITTGSNTIRADRSIAGDFTLSNIDIETDDIPDDFDLPDGVSRSDLVDPEESVESPGITPDFNLPIVLGSVAAIEDSTCREFQRYFGSETFGELAGGQNPCERVRTPEEITAILGNIAAQAGRRASIIYLIDAPDQLELVVFFPQGQPVRRVVPEANREALLAVVQEFRNEVAPLTANGGVDIEKLNSTSYLASAQQLYNWIVAPLQSELESRNIDTLAFIPGAGLRSLPFSALHNGEQFLVEQYSVGLLPSINLIDPRYQSLQNSEILAVGSGEWAERGFELSDLPSVPIEVAAVVQQPWQGEVLLNEQFTLPQIVGELENPSFRILHLATHGEFLPGQPNNSYVQLWNTRLGLTQLQQLQRNQPPVELLTLSACRTALGDESAELGFAGLALASGAKSSLASLWYVSDIGTLSLMTEFYRQLYQVPIKAEALQQTQIAMLRGEVGLQGNQLYGPTGGLQLSDREVTELTTQLEAFGVDDLSHPFFWSAFTMVGSPW